MEGTQESAKAMEETVGTMVADIDIGVQSLVDLVYKYVNYNIYTTIGTAIFAFLFFYVLRKRFAKLMIKGVCKISKTSSLQKKVELNRTLQKPLQDFFIILGIFFAVRILPFGASITGTSFFVLKLCIIVLITWMLYNFCNPSSVIFSKMEERMSEEMAKTVIPFLSNILKLLIIFTGGVIVFSEFGYNISGLIAGVGLGGLAFALAAQDTAANIFGGAVIILDKPFSIGDWIQTPSVEGVVEEISLRSTRVRTFSDSLIVLPNSKITNEAITNWSKMERRKVSFKIGVTYQTKKEKLLRCIEHIKEMLLVHPDVHNDEMSVTFDQFGESALIISIYFFSKEKNYFTYMAVKEDVNYKIMEIFEAQGVHFAYPTATVFVENGEKNERLTAYARRNQ